MDHDQENSKKNLFLSIVSLCFLICWVGSLPKRAILFPQMTLPNVRAMNGSIFALAMVFGVIASRHVYKKSLSFKSTLTLSVFLCLAGTVILYAVPADLQFIASLITFVFFGFCLAIVSQLILSESKSESRILVVGAIVFTRAFLLFTSNVKIPILASIPAVIISISCIIIVIISALLLGKNSELLVTKVPVTGSFKKSKISFLFLILYFVILSVSKGILVQGLSHNAIYNPVYFSIGMIVSYALALLLIIRHPNTPHLHNVVYVANSIMIIAIIINLSFETSPWMVFLINSMLYFSFSINEVFCFDSLFEFGELFGDGSIVFGIAFASISLAQLGGALFYDFNAQARLISSDFLVVMLFALLTIILPSFLIELSKISSVLASRVSSNRNTQGESQLSPTDTSVQVNTVDYDAGLKNLKIIEVLSDREKEVLELILKGLPSKLICSELFISNNTLKSHIQSIYTKLNVHSRSELFLLLKKDPKQS